MLAKRFAVRVLQHRSVAFVTYMSEYSAQFAKEAMACQSLDNDEILNVRWATDDPNQQNKANENDRLAERGRQVIAERLDVRIVEAVRAIRALENEEVLDPESDEEEESEPPAKRQRIEAPPEPEKPRGLLSADTLSGLKQFAELKHKQASKPKAVAPPKPQLALDGYGSDDD